MLIKYCLVGILLLLLSSTAGGRIIIVDNSRKEDFSSIQEAIDTAISGDIVVVDEGQYTENIVVNKELSIISNSTNPEDVVIRPRNPEDSIFSVQANNVTIEGFTLSGMKGKGNGIWLYDSIGCSLKNNIISGNFWGIFLESSDENTIESNFLNDNDRCGIFLVESHQNLVENNNINNQYDGLVLDSSNSNILRDNLICENSNLGIMLRDDSNGNQLYENKMNNNMFNFGDVGGFNEIDRSNLVNGKSIIYLNGVSDIRIDASSNAGTVCCYDCDNITVKDLVVSNNSCGVSFYNAERIILHNLSCTNNGHGIYLMDCSDCTISNCSVQNNSHAGIYLDDSKKCLVEKNKVFYNYYGIYLNADDCELNQNTVVKSTIGIMSGIANSNLIENNGIYNNDIGISFYLSDNNEVENNEFSMNKEFGIFLQHSWNNSITSNTINQNDVGIRFKESSINNSVSGNYLSDNEECFIGEKENSLFNNTCTNANGEHFLSFMYPVDLIFVIIGASWLQMHRN